MKRTIINFAIVAAAAFAIVSCVQKESTTPVQDETPKYVTFEFMANLPADTKTENDGMNTYWSENDQIKVLYEGKYTGLHEVSVPFTYAGDNKFVGKLEWELAMGFIFGSYSTLKAVYPYDTNGEFQPVTVQIGFDSMAHLDEANCPLSGEITLDWNQDFNMELLNNYKLNDVTLNHLTSVLEVAVVNNTTSAVEVSEVDFLVDGEVKATTVVEGAGVLAAGETAKVYVVVEPETYAGSQISFQVNDTFEKKVTVDGDVTFTAGKIKKVNFVLE